jgi:hypothetical protein
MKSHHAKLTTNQEANVTEIKSYIDTQLKGFKNSIQKDFEKLKKDHEAKTQDILDKIGELMQTVETIKNGPRS